MAQIYLPLYSETRAGKFIPEKSGLNQWNADGRLRHSNEVYIRIPAWIHKAFPSFFPERDIPFKLRLPTKNILSAKICQQGRKALMSNPNSDLGRWLLRDVLRCTTDELVEMRDLEIARIDSVKIEKLALLDYSIEAAPLGAFQHFQDKCEP